MNKPYIRKKTLPTYEAKLYMGSRVGYAGREFAEEEIRTAIQEFQEVREVIPVRIANVTFAAGDYHEKGFEIVAINYPRHPRKPSDIWNFMFSLAEHLLVQFEQNRITVIDNEKSILIEDINRAEPEECCQM
jgi:hypothetical protein